VGANSERITRGTLQYRVLRAFRRAGIDSDRARGALVHGLRHAFDELVVRGIASDASFSGREERCGSVDLDSPCRRSRSGLAGTRPVSWVDIRHPTLWMHRVQR
jgi:hypothetical protein